MYVNCHIYMSSSIHRWDHCQKLEPRPTVAKASSALLGYLVVLAPSSLVIVSERASL
jgi:hypothetical protein